MWPSVLHLKSSHLVSFCFFTIWCPGVFLTPGGHLSYALFGLTSGGIGRIVLLMKTDFGGLPMLPITLLKSTTGLCHLGWDGHSILRSSFLSRWHWRGSILLYFLYVIRLQCSISSGFIPNTSENSPSLLSTSLQHLRTIACTTPATTNTWIKIMGQLLSFGTESLERFKVKKSRLITALQSQ